MVVLILLLRFVSGSISQDRALLALLVTVTAAQVEVVMSDRERLSIFVGSLRCDYVLAGLSRFSPRKDEELVKIYWRTNGGNVECIEEVPESRMRSQIFATSLGKRTVLQSFA